MGIPAGEPDEIFLPAQNSPIVAINRDHFPAGDGENLWRLPL